MTKDEPFGSVTRMLQTWADPPLGIETVALIVVELTTCMAVTKGAVPCPPSKDRMAPGIKPEPLMVTLTVVPPVELFGTIPCMFTGVVDVAVLAEVEVEVGGAEVAVAVAGGTVGETGVEVCVAGSGVAEAGAVVPVAVGDTCVGVTGSVGEGMVVGVGVMKIELPNSLHPRSGDAPVNPVIGLGGIGSPLLAVYCVTPLSMAGEPG